MNFSNFSFHLFNYFNLILYKISKLISDIDKNIAKIL